MSQTQIGVVKNFVKNTVAEHECIERIRVAGARVGVDVRVLDVDGTPLDGRRLNDPSDLLFCIALHFETPKLFDCFTYFALWNPVEFYLGLGWGYQRATMNLLSYDDYLSCASDWADAHARLLLRSKRRPGLFLESQNSPPENGHSPEFSTFFHSLAEPIIEPRVQARRLFYCGINWDLLLGRKHRFREVFNKLDATGQIDFYGPERLAGGVRPWKGFRCYRGEVPFDGRSMVERAAESGVVLAFSSDAHKESGLMSSRIFEACAAGALIIADENRWVRKHFADSVFYVDTRAPDEQVTARLIEILDWANAHPEEALRMASRAQQIFLERFELSRSIEQLVATHRRRVESRSTEWIRGTESGVADSVHLAAVVTLDELLHRADLERSLSRSLLVNVRKLGAVSLLAPRIQDLSEVQVQEFSAIWSRLEARLRDAGFTGEFSVEAVLSDSKGALWNEVYEWISSASSRALPPYFVLLGAAEELFSGHLEALSQALCENPRVRVAASSSAYWSRSEDDWARGSRSIEFDPSYRATDWLTAQRASLGRYMFRTENVVEDLAGLPFYGRFAGNAAFLRALGAGTAAARAATSMRAYSIPAREFREEYRRFTAMLPDEFASLGLQQQLTGQNGFQIAALPSAEMSRMSRERWMNRGLSLALRLFPLGLKVRLVALLSRNRFIAEKIAGYFSQRLSRSS